MTMPRLRDYFKQGLPPEPEDPPDSEDDEDDWESWEDEDTEDLIVPMDDDEYPRGGP